MIVLSYAADNKSLILSMLISVVTVFAVVIYFKFKSYNKGILSKDFTNAFLKLSDIAISSELYCPGD